MRSRHLEALEADRFDALPGRAYARAFLRTYAAALDLDAEAFVEEFDEQVPAPPEPEEVASPARRRSRAVPLVAAPVVGLLAVLGVLVWSAWSNDHLSHTAVPALPATVAAPAVVRPITHVRAAQKTIVRPAALVVRAVRGRCWVQARRGGPTGPVLAEQTLEPGESLRLSAQHVWLRLGAPWNVDVHRGVRTVKLTATTEPQNIVT